MDVQKERIIERKTERDTWKLNHWDNFKQRVEFVPEVNWNIPASSVTVFDNSGELTDAKIEGLYQFITADPE
ncbi:hypothetical protein D3C80_2223120 [compost metagenome]